MEGVSLLGTNIRGVRMVDLSFPFKGFALLWGRYLAGDEPRPSRLIEFGRRLKEAVKAKRWQSNPKSSVDYQSLAVLYRDLQANYTDSGDYARANWFFVSEKEMEWKRRNWWRHVFSLHTYYWLFSNFGQSLLLPVLWILLVVPIFTLIMIHVGDIDGISWSATGNFRIFLDACVKNFTMVFNRPLVVMYLAKYPWSQLLNIVETGAVLSLLSLIVVAARRRLSNRNL